MAQPILGVTHSDPGALPPGACDCHTHVFGPEGAYRFGPGRTYTPPEAPAELLRRHQDALGLHRVVIVQPSPYGTDNRCTLDAVRALGGRARAVAVVDPGLGIDALRVLHAGGVRGVRVNLQTAGHHDPDSAGALLRAAAEQVAPLGWHVQTFTNPAVLAALRPVLRSLPVPLVVDHFGLLGAGAGPGDAGFDAVAELVGSGRAYVKLSGAHRVSHEEDGAAPLAAALIALNPARMLWGSDWPHPGTGPRAGAAAQPFDPIDDGAALRRLRNWAGDEAVFRAILADNPAGLYGFGP